jgi:hypothetical protein
MFTALVCLSSLAWGQVSTSDAAAAEGLKAQVDRWVALLDHREAARREAAEKELVALGADVLPLLPATTARTPAELRIRLERVRKALVAAEIAAATQPALVSLSGEMPLSQAIAEITRQTGNKLVDYRERFNQESPDPKIKVELDKVSFWQALDSVLDAADLTIYNYDEEKGALAYTSRGAEAVPRTGRGSYSGLFRLEPTKIEATRDLRNPAVHGLRLSIDAVWEPRIRPIVLEVPLPEASAKDENASEIAVDRSEGTLEVPVGAGSAAVEIELPLVAPPRSVRSLASVRGKLTAVVLGKVETFEFANVDKARSAELERGGVTVVVESCRKNGDVYAVSMRVRFDRAANALESHRGWIYENECYLADTQGNQILPATMEAVLLAVNEVGLAYMFDLGENVAPEGYKFVYRTPAAIIKIPVDFELKGIELP